MAQLTSGQLVLVSSVWVSSVSPRKVFVAAAVFVVLFVLPHLRSSSGPTAFCFGHTKYPCVSARGSDGTIAVALYT